MQSLLPRSALFMPGSNARALEKARTLACDAVIFDLEDSVAPGAKAQARDFVQQALAQRAEYGDRTLAVRTNALSEPDFSLDLPVAQRADVVVVPKVSSVTELTSCQRALDGSAAALWVMIETPQAVLNIREMAAHASSVAPSLQAFVLGANDLALGAGVPQVAGRWNMLAWFSEVILAASAAGLAVFDSVSNNFRDLDRFEEECLQGVELGMAGKTLIHPAQIEACNRAYGPKAIDIERAQAIISAFDDPAHANRGAVQIEGEMVERLHLASAHETIRRARAFGLTA